MSVRHNTHDGGVVERRLRPIYDWLDNGNNKKALQEAEKVLKKSPSLQAARALKALALYRLGKGPEALSVLEALAEEKPSDDTTLQAMTIAYRESQQLSKVCSLYEEAVKCEPQSEELYSHLFMSYVRVGDYRAQQRAAMALYKFAPKNPYYFWAVMSIVLQAKSSEDPTKKGILLSLAQRMIDNFIAENKMEAEQEARLYIMILEQQEKWDDIIKFMDGPLYWKFQPSTFRERLILYLKKVGNWSKVQLTCKDLLFDNQDRWDYHMWYLDSVFHLMKDTQEQDQRVDNTAEDCHEYLCWLIEKNIPSGKLLRGPYLARMELWKRLSVDGDPTALLGSAVSLCVQYLTMFAHKPCVVSDLRPYIAMIPQKEREEHAKEFLTCLNFDVDSEPETAEDIQRQLSCICAWRLCAAPAHADEYITFANTLRKHYVRCLSRGLVTATTTEFCAADGYGIVAAHLYYYAAQQQKSSAPIVEALCVLELVLHHSPANFHTKLLLVTLYHLLGNAIAADSIYVKLETKHVQLVSLRWLHAARLAANAAPARALQLLTYTGAFYAHHAKDCVDHLTYAYKYGTFEKLVELYAWNSRLSKCGGGALAGRERALLAPLGGPGGVGGSQGPLPKNPTDNRDLNVIVNWDPPQLKDEDLKERTFDEEIAYLRLKDGLVSALTLCGELAEFKPAEDKTKQYEELKICVDAFSSAMEKCKEKYVPCDRFVSISSPFPSRIIAFVNSPVPYRELYSTAVLLVAELSMGSNARAHDLCAQVTQLVATAADTLGAEVKGDGDPLWRLKDVLECYSNYLEFIGIIIYLVGLCNDIAQHSKKSTKKKKVQSPDETKTLESLNNLNTELQKSLAFLENSFEQLPKYDVNPSLQKVLVDYNINYTCQVKNKLVNGQSEMVSNIKQLLQMKAQSNQCRKRVA